jgi:hypothetical protein
MVYAHISFEKPREATQIDANQYVCEHPLSRQHDWMGESEWFSCF